MKMGFPEIGAIAQLGERYNGIVEVSGSIPLGSTTISPQGFQVRPIRRGGRVVKGSRL
jgi:hypothetical protein